MMKDLIKRKYFPPESEVLKITLGKAMLNDVSNQVAPEMDGVTTTYDGNNDPNADVDW